MIEGIVGAVARLVRDRYVFVERGAAAAAAVEARRAEGAYEGLAEEALCGALTTDLRAVCPDRHLKVVHHRDALERWDGDGWGPAALADYWAAARLDNHGVARVERLPGNVGYLDLRGIDDAEHTAPAITAAMTLVRHTYALMLDLRANNGGSPSGVAFLCSFFVPPEPVHLNDVYSRVTGSTQQFWSYAHLPGPRYLDRPVYVLTGPRTFSGAEEVAYNLQQLGRATLVGETTMGGAHPVGDHWVGPHVSVRVPEARSINPISGTNWEGVGVTPDVAVPAADAYDEAYGRCLRHVVDRLTTTDAAGKRDGETVGERDGEKEDERDGEKEDERDGEKEDERDGEKEDERDGEKEDERDGEEGDERGDENVGGRGGEKEVHAEAVRALAELSARAAS